MGKRPVWSEYDLQRSDVGRRRAKRLCVALFCGSWDGLTLRDMERGSGACNLVDCKFLCSMRRCPLLVAVDFLRCFVIRDLLSPGQEEKWPRCMARRNVEIDGLKTQPCKKAASSLFVCLLRIMLFARCCFVELEGLVSDLGASGMFQSPLVVLLFPLMTIFPSLLMSTWYLEKRVMQSSSQSWPVEMRDPWRSSKKWLTCACLERVADKGTVARREDSMWVPVATWTEGPDVVW
jgi:hypothetical protein